MIHITSIYISLEKEQPDVGRVSQESSQKVLELQRKIQTAREQVCSKVLQTEQSALFVDVFTTPPMHTVHDTLLCSQVRKLPGVEYSREEQLRRLEALRKQLALKKHLLLKYKSKSEAPH